MRACARGLFDTDGSVYTHSYRVNGKRYSYKKMSYSSRSLPLLHSFADLMIDLGLKPAIRYKKDVRLEDTHDVAQYFRLIGTHNPKHLKRYQS